MVEVAVCTPLNAFFKMPIKIIRSTKDALAFHDVAPHLICDYVKSKFNVKDFQLKILNSPTT